MEAVLHQHDPDMAPDSAFVAGALERLVPGNRGRMLDPRRTPVRILAVQESTATFVCEVTGFEDRGARWELPFEQVGCFQFEPASARASPAVLGVLSAARERFDRTLELPCDRSAARRTRTRLATLRREAASWLAAESTFCAAGGALDLASRRGDPRLWRDLRRYLEAWGVWEMEDAFAATFVSNPYSGERVKGHRIVLAELGLAPYRGNVVRDPATFAGAWTKAARAEHVLVRMAFVQALFAGAGRRHVTLYRGVSGRPDPDRAPVGFVSATFQRAVAVSMLGPPGRGVSGVVTRLAAPVARLFMTYLETEHMNRQFQEAEAVIITGTAAAARRPSGVRRRRAKT